MVLALRKAEHRRTPENSTCIIFKTPFTAEGEIQFRRANGERIRAPSERWMRIEDCLDHIFKFRWHGEQLELLVDNTHIITLPLGESQWVDPWSRTAAMCVAAADKPPTS